MRVKLLPQVGDFGEDKDAAATIREQVIKPSLQNQDEIVELDFTGVRLITQSFAHALLSDVLRINGEDILDRIEFLGCESNVKGVIETVVQYSLDIEDIESMDAG